MDGFIRPDALARLNAAANALLPTAETLHVKRSIYQGAIDPDLPDDDPRRVEVAHVDAEGEPRSCPEAEQIHSISMTNLEGEIASVQKTDDVLGALKLRKRTAPLKPPTGFEA